MNIQFKVVFLLFFLASCASIKNKEMDYEVIYEAQTRGVLEVISFKGNTIKLKTNTEIKTIVLKQEKISAIKSVLSKIKLSEIARLIPPSNQRNFDGAMAATITIKKVKNTYISSSFDHDNPPKELAPLLFFLRETVK